MRKILLLITTICCAQLSAQSATTDSISGKDYSYAFGITQAEGLKKHLVKNAGVDTTYMDDVVKGLQADPNSKEAKRAIAYAAGLKIGKMNRTAAMKYINQSATGKVDTTYCSLPDFTEAITCVLLGKSTRMTRQKAEAILRKQQEYMSNLYKENNIHFLTANAKQPGIKTLPGGIQYRVLEKGDGKMPERNSNVEVHYEGKLINGQIFDSSYRRGKPAHFGVSQVIKGWTEALLHMHEGDTWELFIPADMAYGERNMQTIPANSTLIFKVQLIKVM